MPPPFGSSTIEDFSMLYHVYIKEAKAKGEDEAPKEDNEEDEKEFDMNDEKTYDKKVVENITDLWLNVKPSKENFYKELMKCIGEGGNSI